jgi:methanogenic corrinoid protein MtbC1
VVLEASLPDDTPVFNTAAVVRRTGVPAATFRAWERRYGFPHPARDEGGQRRYSPRDVQAISWLAEQTARGVAVSRAVEILRQGLAGPGATQRPALETPRSPDALRRDLLAALLDLDPVRADRIVREAFSLYSVEDVCLEVFEPLLIEVGDRWHGGELSVAEEHYVSAFVRGRLFVLLHASASGSLGPLLLTACAPNEWHEVGMLLVSVFLARRGYAVRYLGPSLPFDDLVRLATRHRPALVLVSAQSREAALSLAEVSRLLAALGPDAPHLAFGGRAFNLDPALRVQIGGIYVGPDAAATVDLVQALLGRT